MREHDDESAASRRPSGRDRVGGEVLECPRESNVRGCTGCTSATEPTVEEARHLVATHVVGGAVEAGRAAPRDPAPARELTAPWCTLAAGTSLNRWLAQAAGATTTASTPTASSHRVHQRRGSRTRRAGRPCVDVSIVLLSEFVWLRTSGPASFGWPFVSLESPASFRYSGTRSHDTTAVRTRRSCFAFVDPRTAVGRLKGGCAESLVEERRARTLRSFRLSRGRSASARRARRAHPCSRSSAGQRGERRG